MSVWRLWVELPSVRTREGVRSPQMIDGWMPWQHFWTRLNEPDIVVPDPSAPSRWRHIRTYQSNSPTGPARFAAEEVDGIWRFYIPASISEEGAFEAPEQKNEGHWRATEEEDSDLPWPELSYDWAGRELFLRALERVELTAEKIAYRGLSLCRMCRCINGHEALRLAEWEWPAGYKHYIAEHSVRPSAEFEEFILNLA